MQLLFLLNFPCNAILVVIGVGGREITPGPIEIIVPEEGHKFKLDIEALEEILCEDDVRDKPVVVLSVAGAFRKGKSFLLDFFLRYLCHKVKMT